MLKGKTALVTGSTSGIGLGIAKALAAQGADVMLNGFGDAAQIETLRADLEREHGVRVAFSGADLGRPADVRALAQHTLDTFGRLDILVNNAGIQHVAAIQDFPVERWDAIIAINLSSAFHAMRLAIPAMRATSESRRMPVKLLATGTAGVGFTCGGVL